MDPAVALVISALYRSPGRIVPIRNAIDNLPVLPRDKVSLEDNCPICLVPFGVIFKEEDEANAKEKEKADSTTDRSGNNEEEVVGEKQETPDDPNTQEVGGITMLTGCGHIFCRRDLIEWIRSEHGNCPTCRNTFLELPEHSEWGDESSDGGEYVPSGDDEEDAPWDPDLASSDMVDDDAYIDANIDHYLLHAADMMSDHSGFGPDDVDAQTWGPDDAAMSDNQDWGPEVNDSWSEVPPDCIDHDEADHEVFVPEADYAEESMNDGEECDDHTLDDEITPTQPTVDQYEWGVEYYIDDDNDSEYIPDPEDCDLDDYVPDPADVEEIYEDDDCDMAYLPMEPDHWEPDRCDLGDDQGLTDGESLDVSSDGYMDEPEDADKSTPVGVGVVELGSEDVAEDNDHTFCEPAHS